MSDEVKAPVRTKDEIRAEMVLWHQKYEQLQLLRAEESAMRKRLFKEMFPSAQEGTNKFDFGNGYEVRGKQDINRDVSEQDYDALKASALAAQENRGANIAMTPDELKAWEAIPFDELLRWKPSLSLTAYRKLTPEQTHLVDQMLIIKEGSVSMEVKPVSTRRATRK